VSPPTSQPRQLSQDLRREQSLQDRPNQAVRDPDLGCQLPCRERLDPPRTTHDRFHDIAQVPVVEQCGRPPPPRLHLIIVHIV
jgi:hypothetical protein